MTDAAQDIIGLYRRHAEAWADRRGQSLFERSWLDRFAGHVAGARHVLDLGCGFGRPIADYLIRSGCQVTGVDTSPALLQRAAREVPEGSWVEADMRGLDLGRGFQGVLAWNSFFHLTPEDQRGMFAVFAAHSEPGAPLMFTSGTSYGARMGTLLGDPLYHASLEPKEYGALLDAFGFDLVAHVAEDPTCNQHTVWLAVRRED